MASSEIVAMSGMVRMPTPMPAARRLKPLAVGKKTWMTLGVITVSAKKPRTTLGMPARISRMGLTMPRVRGPEYSAR